MKGKSNLEHRSMISFAAALLATILALGIFAAVTGMFRSEGVPMERVAVAERACASHVYVSEREDCMRGWLAAQQAKQVAGR